MVQNTAPIMTSQGWPYKKRFDGWRYYLNYRLGRKPAHTQTTPGEQQCLKKYAANQKRLVEIGVYQGYSTLSFRRVMDENGIIVAVDPYVRRWFGMRGYGWMRLIAHREVAKCNRGRVIWVETFGKDAVNHPEVKPHLPVDFVFVDADHSWEGISGDWNAWSGNIRVGGVIALHDSINTDNFDSERFTKEVALQDDRYQVEEVVDSLTVLRRVR